MRKAVLVLLIVTGCAALSGPVAALVGAPGHGLLGWDDLAGLLRPFLSVSEAASTAAETDNLLLLGEGADLAPLLASRGGAAAAASVSPEHSAATGLDAPSVPAAPAVPAAPPRAAAAGEGATAGQAIGEVADLAVLGSRREGATTASAAGPAPQAAGPAPQAAGPAQPAQPAQPPPLGVVATAAAPATPVVPQQAGGKAASPEQGRSIRGFAGPAALRSFFEALRALQAGQRQTVHVVHLGDSEIAGDGVTDTIRKEMSRRFGYGGPGFALAMKGFPSYYRQGWEHPSAKDFRARSYPLKQAEDGAYGPGGVAFDAKKVGASAEVKLTGEAPAAGCAVSFFYWRQPDGGTLELAADGQPFAELDSAAAQPGSGVLRQSFAPCPRKLKVTVTSAGPTRIFGWSVIHATPGIVWSSMGVLSARDAHLANYGPGLIGAALQDLEPDLLVLSFGLNLTAYPQIPGKYKQELEPVVARVRSEVPRTDCLLVGPYPNGVSLDGEIRSSPSVPYISRKQEQVALEQGCAFMDRFVLSGGAKATRQWLDHQPKLLAADLVHLTHVGAARMGRVMSLVLWSGYQLHLGQAGTGGGR